MTEQRMLGKYELLDEIDLPFPLGGCFGYWGYDLKNFVEPRLPRRAVNDLELPDYHLGFYDSLVAFDHALGKTWLVSTGLELDGSRSEARARRAGEFWESLLQHGTDSGADLQQQPEIRNPKHLARIFHTVRFGAQACCRFCAFAGPKPAASRRSAQRAASPRWAATRVRKFAGHCQCRPQQFSL